MTAVSIREMCNGLERLLGDVLEKQHHCCRYRILLKMCDMCLQQIGFQPLYHEWLCGPRLARAEYPSNITHNVLSKKC